MYIYVNFLFTGNKKSRRDGKKGNERIIYGNREASSIIAVRRGAYKVRGMGNRVASSGVLGSGPRKGGLAHGDKAR